MGIRVLELKIPKEPLEIKELMRTVRARMSKEGGQSEIDYDSLAVWSFNRLPKYLWEQWKNDLKEQGITWQNFLRILKLHTLDMIEWALKDSLQWSDLVRKLENSIKNYSKRK